MESNNEDIRLENLGDFDPFSDENDVKRTEKFPHAPVWTVGAGLLAVVLFGVLLIYLRFILVPLAIARAITYCMRPLINFLNGKKTIRGKRCCLGNGLSVALTLLTVIIVATAIGILLFFSIKRVVADWDEYQERATELLEKLLEWVDARGMDRKQMEDAIRNFDGGGLALATINSVLLILPGFFTVLLITLYMLTDYDGEASGSKNDFQRSMDAKIRSYIMIKVAISAATGVCVGIILLVLRVKMAVVFGLLTFVLNFIPAIGSLVAVLLPLPIVILDSDVGVFRAILTFVLPLCVQMIFGNVIEPRVAGKAMAMSSVAVLLSLSFWGSVWGLPGAFMAVPLTVVFRLMLESSNHPTALWLERILAGDFRIAATTTSNSSTN